MALNFGAFQLSGTTKNPVENKVNVFNNPKPYDSMTPNKTSSLNTSAFQSKEQPKSYPSPEFKQGKITLWDKIKSTVESNPVYQQVYSHVIDPLQQGVLNVLGTNKEQVQKESDILNMHYALIEKQSKGFPLDAYEKSVIKQGSEIAQQRMTQSVVGATAPMKFLGPQKLISAPVGEAISKNIIPKLTTYVEKYGYENPIVKDAAQTLEYLKQTQKTGYINPSVEEDILSKIKQFGNKSADEIVKEFKVLSLPELPKLPSGITKPFLTTPAEKTLPKVAPETSPLAQEAQKYKSAEEFVNSQKSNFDNFIKTKVPEIQSYQDGKIVLKDGTTGRFTVDTNGGDIQIIDIQLDKKGTGIGTKLVNATKDFGDLNKRDVQVIKPYNGEFWQKFGVSEDSNYLGNLDFKNGQKVKSQLTDIYNQAVKTAPEAKLRGAVATNTNKVVKEATVGKNIPTKQVINQQTGVKQNAPTVELTNTQLLKKEEQIANKASKSAVSQYKRDKAFLENIDREITRELNVPKGKQRSVVAFVKKLGEFNQTVTSEIKAELGIEKPISKMNLTELKDFISKLKERLKFKFEKGYRPSAETKETLKLKDTPQPELNYLDYEKNRTLSKTKTSLGSKLAKQGKKIGKTTDKLLGTLSTRFANIDPTLKYALRKFEYNAMNAIQKDKLAIKPFLVKIKQGFFKGITKDDFADLDLALKNGDKTKIDEITKKYGIEKEYNEVKKTLDNIYKRANEVGFDIGYRKDYFPRMIKDTEGFLEYFGKQEYWSILEEAIQRKEMELGRYLLPEEKGNLINTMIRGYQSGQITLSGTGNMKDRVIDLVTPELNKFYYNSPTALLKYIDGVDDKIAARKFFGKGNKIEGFNNVEDSIGAYTTDLLTKGKITSAQELELRDMLNARFNPKGTHGIVGMYKNLAYMDVMGSFLNAITQIGDQSWAIYKGGLWGTIKSDVKTLIGKSKITKEDLGIEAGGIAQEFSDGGKLAKTVDKLFTLTGLNKMDRLGKQALVNASIEKYMKMAKNPKIDFLKKLDEIFGKESEQVLEDLKSGEITENVKVLAFNELLDFHPVAFSEMPEQYLKGGNGRIFYMLKSYTLKQFDIFRREAFQEMAKGNWLKGIKNLLYLASLIIITNGTAQEIKDLLTNRKTKLSDIVIDQIAQLAGFSRYNLGKISEVGFGSAMVQQITPPFNAIDNISKDLINLYKDFDKSADINKLTSVQDIPLIGKFYYWWFGKGATNTKKYAPKPESGMPSLPSLPKLPTLPTLPKLPSI